MYWIYDIPNGLLALLFCAISLTYTLGGLLLLRPRVRRWLGSEPGCNDFVSYFLSAYGVFYGLMLGLIAVATYQNFADVDRIVGKEATSIAALYRDMESYPEPVREQLQTHVRGYVQFLIDEAWPSQQQGHVHSAGTARITAMQKDLHAYVPRDARQSILHAETLRQYNTFLEARYARIASVSTALSGVLWAVVILGGAMNLALLWFFSLDKLSLHLVLSAILAGFVGLMLYFIAAMDNPFRGEESVSPDAYRLILGQLMTPAPN